MADTKVILFFFVILMLSIPIAASAEPVLVLNYAICKNDSVSINSIKYADGTAKVYQGADGEYELRMTSENGNAIASLYLPVSFYLHSEPPRDVDCSIGYQRLPWESDAKSLEFYHDDRLLKKIDLSGYICNRNNLCEPDSGENTVNCPRDCPRETAKPKPADSTLVFAAAVLAAAVLVIAVLVYYNKKRNP